MPKLRRADDKKVEHRVSKYDGFKIVVTGKPYRHQKGSGRQQIFDLAKDGMLIKDWTKLCAAKGFDTKFVTGSLKKLHGAEYAAFKFSAKDESGKTLAEVTKQREKKEPAVKGKPTTSADPKVNAKAAKNAKK